MSPAFLELFCSQVTFVDPEMALPRLTLDPPGHTLDPKMLINHDISQGSGIQSVVKGSIHEFWCRSGAISPQPSNKDTQDTIIFVIIHRHFYTSTSKVRWKDSSSPSCLHTLNLKIIVWQHFKFHFYSLQAPN